MSKKRISKKPGLWWQDIEEVDIDPKKLKHLKKTNPENFFKDEKKVASALFECLKDNDTESYIEILDEYLKVNRTKLAKKAKIGRSTIQEVFSKKGNPTLKTIAKIVHYSSPVISRAK